MNTSNWKIVPVTCSTRGLKYASIECNYEPIRWKAPSTKTPFNASPWNPTDTRVNLDLILTEELQAFGEAIDKFVPKALVEHSSALFKKEMTEEQIRAIYKPVICEHEKIAPTLRCKINIPGAPTPIRCYDQDKQPRDPPSDWRQCALDCMITVGKVWFMSGKCGVSLEIKDVLISNDESACPF